MAMRLIIIALFLALAAFAQEMDTTFVVNEQGQTVGIIHEKGTVPTMPQTAPTVAPATDPFATDSTQYYQDLIETNTRLANSRRNVGKKMMLTGGIGAAVGGAIMFAGLLQVPLCDEDDDDGCEASNTATALFSIGYLLALDGAIAFTTGFILKINGGSKQRRANRYKESLDLYNLRKQHSLKMQISPMINPYNGSLGSRLSLNF